MQFENMTESQLLAMRTKIDEALRGAKKRNELQAVREFHDIARNFGWTPDQFLEVIANHKGNKKAMRAATDSAKSPKTPARVYVAPGDPSKKWSGMGRRPAWFAEALAEGISADQMAAASH